MSLEFSATVADRDVEVALSVSPGETVALLGPNGSGKSTVLSVIAGLLRPDTGVVRLDGRTLTSVEPGRRGGAQVPPHRRQIALLAQDPLLFPHLSVRENVAFGPRGLGVSRSAARATADRWLEEVDATALAARKPGELSGGQAQRVAVARALAAEPHLLLLDEPMAALDVAVTPALRQTLRRVLSDRTAIIVTHDVLDAFLLADRVVVLDQGRVVESGPSADVLGRPRTAFTARLTGLNMLIGTWADGQAAVEPGPLGGAAVQGVVAGTPPVDGDRVAATFRPHAVAVYRARPSGSPRNAFEVAVTDVEPIGDLFRVRAGGLSADVTAQAVAELDLVPGAEVTFVVKATEVTVYRY